LKFFSLEKAEQSKWFKAEAIDKLVLEIMNIELRA
jgi:hypothetical protein